MSEPAKEPEPEGRQDAAESDESEPLKGDDEASETNDSEESCTEVQKESKRRGIEGGLKERRGRLVFGLPGSIGAI